MIKTGLALFHSVPVAGYVVAGMAALFFAITSTVTRHGDRRFEDGRRSALQSAPVDSVVKALAKSATETAASRVDTVVRRVTVTRWRVDTLLQRLPDSLRVVPEVEHLVRLMVAFTAQVDTLTRAIDTERAARTIERTVADQQILALRGVVVVTQDSVRSLARRPTRRAQITTGIFGAVIGALVGVGR
jgi:hypothetical protein